MLERLLGILCLLGVIFFALALIFLSILPCTDADRERCKPTLIADVDGTKLYRICQTKCGGDYVFFTNHGRTQWTEQRMCGKIPCPVERSVE